MQISKGSEWNRWDLHIHTPNTKLNDQFKDMDGNKVNKSENNLIWKEYCRKLNESGVKVFGITDYFSVTNYLFLKKNRDNLGLDKDIKLFPNVELRVTGLVPKGKNRSHHKQVNVHVIFSNDVSSDELNEFLTNLKVEDDSGKRLNFKNHLDTLIKNDYFSHVPDYRSIEESLKSSLGNSYRDNTLILVPNGDDGLSTKTGTQQQANINFMKNSVDIVQTTNERDVHHYLNEVYKYYGRSIPCVSGSDAHDFKSIEDYPLDKSTWIKADLTFEGLKSILYEPAHRVKIQLNNPSTKVESKVIDHIKLPKEEFNEQVIHFNENMNVIIGGRSSGKSLLLSMIGKKAGYSKGIKGHNEKYNKLIDNKINDTEIYYKDGRPIKDMLIEYFYQDSLQQIARDREPRNSFINRTLTDIEIIESMKKDLDAKKDIINEKIDELLKKKEMIRGLYEANKNLQNIEDLEKNIRELNRKIEENTVKLTDEDKKAIKEKENEIEKIEKRKRELEQNLIKINEVHTQDVFEYNNRISPETIRFLKEKFPQYENELKVINIQYKESIEKMKTKLINDRDTCTDKIEEIKSDPLMAKYFDAIRKSPNLEKFVNTLENEKDNLEKKKENDDKIEKINKNIILLVDEISELLNWENYINREEVLSKNRLAITYEFNINHKNLVDIMKEHLKTKLTIYKDVAHGGFKEIINFEEEGTTELTSNDFVNTLKEIMLLNETDIFKAQRSLDTLLNKISNFDYVQDDYKITYEDIDFEVMSEGKKALVLLLIKLEVGKEDCPILIDQPEDNLDNRSIVEDIVSYFKEEKLKRQLFIVTHNANIVIGGDSENVIVANEHDEEYPNPDEVKYYYKNGSLEEKVIRNEVCKILEGGVEAFRSRETRYSF